MDALTKQVRAFEQTIVATINNCGLPPVVCRLVLANVLNEVKNIEENTKDPSTQPEKGGDDNGNSLHENELAE